MRKLFLILLTFMIAVAATSAQDIDPVARAARWKEFDRNGFEKLDYSKVKLTRAKIAKLKTDDDSDDFALVRGVIFGKHGRIFKEQSIQLYLEKQPWYKPDPKFSNRVLTPTERANLDFIRLVEAEKHYSVEPGDMRLWRAKLITDENVRDYTGAEISILIAEIEAIHGKTFPNEEWLQKYFDERYWYKRNASYDPAALSDIERKNIAKFTDLKNQGRHTAVSIGDMDNFQTVALTEDKLAGLSILELRILREEFYARHGKKYTELGVADYFNWRDWYKPARDQKAIKLTKIEQQNVDVLTAYESKVRERLATEPLAEGTLGDMFAEDLKVLRNEIYARHGRIFKDPELQKYFLAQPWYKPNTDFKDDQLNEIEAANLKKIKEAEDSATSKFAAAEG